MLKWLQKRKDMLPDYPLHVCEWCDLSSVALLAKALHRCVWRDCNGPHRAGSQQK